MLYFRALIFPRNANLLLDRASIQAPREEEIERYTKHKRESNERR